MIDWQPGPPPNEWSDGRSVLVWAYEEVSIVYGHDGFWLSEPDSAFPEDDIDFHSEINAPLTRIQV